LAERIQELEEWTRQVRRIAESLIRQARNQ
jgi:hypothetical protein